MGTQPCATYLSLGIPEGWKELINSDIQEPRKDILKFRSLPLEQPVEIAGPVSVRLYVSTSAVDTDFTAKLTDIYPNGDGCEILLLDSIMRLKYRNGFEKSAEPLKYGEVAEIVIDLWDISCVFNKGHCIGISISSSNYPRFEINPNNGDDFPSSKEMVIAENTVYMGGSCASALILPVKKLV